jgi:hypothetical protein
VTRPGGEGIEPRPAEWPEVEVYTPERIAELLPNNAINERDYLAALEEVSQMDIDPATVPHDPF